MFDKFKDECGVFGVYGHPEASKLTYLGLYSLQHRGQESAGIASADGIKVRAVRQMGYVNEIFDEATIAKADAATSAAVEPQDDIHASAAYRRSLVGTMVERALKSAAAA